MHRSGIASFVLLILLFLPPLAGVLFRQAEQSSEDDMASADARVRELETQVEVYRRRLHSREAEARLLTAWNETHSAHIGRVLPVQDVSPQRDSIWIHCGSDAPLEAFTRSTAVVSFAGDLIGRVRRVYSLRRRSDKDDHVVPRTGGVVVVQGLADPKFAVRFRTETAWGFLKGTGEREDGRALLDIRHVMGDLVVEEGTTIFSEGDAIFPEGILLGTVVRSRGGKSDHEFQVLAESDSSTIPRVVVLADEAAGSASRLVKEDR